MKPLDLSIVVRAISGFLYRFHVILFTLFVLGGLSYATFALNQAISEQSSTNAPKDQGSFDNGTMTKIKNLHTTTDQPKLELPSGRINPFQ